MCSIAAAGLVLSAAGAVSSYMGGQQQAKAAEAQGEYRAQVARNNQVIAERAAEDARLRGVQAEKNQRQQTSALIGRQRAVLASNGVQANEGSAVLITGDSAAFGELDALTIRNNAEREAVNLRQQAQNFGSDATFASAGGRNDAAAARINSTSSFLSNTARVADRWYGFKKEQVGVFGRG